MIPRIEEASGGSREPTGWEPGGKRVREALRGLTRAQRHYVEFGIHGDCTMRTIRELKRKGMIYLKITSPNGHCGFMERTPLGENVRALIRSRAHQINDSKEQGQ